MYGLFIILIYVRYALSAYLLLMWDFMSFENVQMPTRTQPPPTLQMILPNWRGVWRTASRVWIKLAVQLLWSPKWFGAKGHLWMWKAKTSVMHFTRRFIASCFSGCVFPFSIFYNLSNFSPHTHTVWPVHVIKNFHVYCINTVSYSINTVFTCVSTFFSFVMPLEGGERNRRKKNTFNSSLKNSHSFLLLAFRLNFFLCIVVVKIIFFLCLYKTTVVEPSVNLRFFYNNNKNALCMLCQS